MKRIFIIFSVSIILVFSLLSYYTFKETTRAIVEKERKDLDSIAKSIYTQMQRQIESVEIGVLTLANNVNIQKTFAERDRDELVRVLMPVYENISQKVSQMQFHLPDSTSFLRLHQLDKYGDSLKDFRFTVNEANAKKEIIKGLEEGVAGYGFRVVVPMFYEGVHTGSVEYGSNFGSNLLTALKGDNSDEYFIYCLRDHEIYSINKGVIGYTSEDIWKIDIGPYVESLKNGETLYLTSKDGIHNIMLMPFTDYNGDIAGYFKVVNDRSEIIKRINRTKINTIIFTTLLSAAILILFYVF